MRIDVSVAYLIGAIIGDGTIAGSKRRYNPLVGDYRISIEGVNKEYLEQGFYPVAYALFSPKSKVRRVTDKRGHRLPRWSFQFSDKKFHYFLANELGLGSGKKAHRVKIPDVIMGSEDDILRHFIAGLFDTDGGLRGKSIGQSTASKQLNNDVVEILRKFGFTVSEEKWINRKYLREYYGWKIRKSEVERFLNVFPLRNDYKIKQIQERVLRGCQSLVK